MFFSELLHDLRFRVLLYSYCCIAAVCAIIFELDKNIIGTIIVYIIMVLLFKLYMHGCIKRYLDISSDIRIEVENVEVDKLPLLIHKINSIDRLHYKNWIINLKDLGFVIISSIIISLLYAIIPLNATCYGDLPIFNGITCSLLASVGMFIIINNTVLFNIAKNKLTNTLKESKDILSETEGMMNVIETDEEEMDMIWEEYRENHKYLTETEVRKIIKRKRKNTTNSK